MPSSDADPDVPGVQAPLIPIAPHLLTDSAEGGDLGSVPSTTAHFLLRSSVVALLVLMNPLSPRRLYD